MEIERRECWLGRNALGEFLHIRFRDCRFFSGLEFGTVYFLLLSAAFTYSVAKVKYLVKFKYMSYF